jgi:acyl-ACP thioesterase
MRRSSLVKYAFYCVDAGDNMSARVYTIDHNGHVTRTCYVAGCLASLRQRIPRTQAAREIAILRHTTPFILRRKD